MISEMATQYSKFIWSKFM